MNLSGSIAGASLGGLIGAILWIVIGYATGYEIGILAVGVGLACGMGAAIGAKGRAGTSGALAAACCALVAIVGARIVLVQLAVDQILREAMAGESTDIRGPDDDIFWTSFIADRIAQQREAAGQEIDWSATDHEDDLVANDFPPDIWAEAQGKWQGFSPADREAFCKVGIQSLLTSDENAAAGVRTFANIVGALYLNLKPMALIFTCIAMAGAFRVARNSRPAGSLSEAEADFASSESENEQAVLAAPPMSGLPKPPPPPPTPRAAATTAPKAAQADGPAPLGLPGMPPPSGQSRFPQRAQPPAAPGDGPLSGPPREG